MAYFLFVDESGQDHRASPNEVLAGVAIKDSAIWPFIQRLHTLEEEHFGMRVSAGKLELKGKKLLKSKVFRHASQLGLLDPETRRNMAKTCLLNGKNRQDSGKSEIAGLGQAKIAFVKDMLTLCAQFRIKVFASIVSSLSLRPSDNTMLRKDYAYLFERYFYFLEDKRGSMGGIVFDELEKTQSHILVNQMEQYFLKTRRGRERSSHIIPEPFFVHSDLTTLIQVADIVAYIISWGVKIGSMPEPKRPELADLASQVCSLRFQTRREVNGSDGREERPIWSFTYIRDLRPNSEQME